MVYGTVHITYLFINRFYLIEFSFYDTKLYRQVFMQANRKNWDFQINLPYEFSDPLPDWMVGFDG